MRVRRCAILMLEPREKLGFHLALLADGGSGLQRSIDWVAIAPHRCEEAVVTASEREVLADLSPSEWIELESLAATHPCDAIETLMKKELVIAEASDADTRDRQIRDTHWRASSAVAHSESRWHGVDTEAADREFAEVVEETLLQRLGPPPPPVCERTPASQRVRLPAAGATPLDALLGRRVTCRNFDASHVLTQAQFAAVLYRTYGARAVNDFAPGVKLLKKSVPSAGGLHATEAYLLIQRVEGIGPGLYHYHAIDQALEPIRVMNAADTAALARRFVASQSYFLGAPVFVIAVSRFGRNFWKYRNHAKAYRALILDVGHLSQTMYLAATELGLAAFITAAINEVDIEEAFGLDPLEEGPLAVCGFGLRGRDCKEVEFDPLHAVWKKR